jgi:MFS family permease
LESIEPSRAEQTSTDPRRPRMPRAIWALGLVSLLMDVSSELIHSLLPMFMLTALHANALTIGLVDGIGEATALVVKVFSGPLSDRWGKRKPLALLGYGLGAASKPLFALASSSGLILGARVIDRVGKGMRGAPRDALVADLAPESMRGAAFGLRQSLDTVGAFMGPALGIGLMLVWADDFRLAFWVAVVPALCSVLLLLLGVQEPARPPVARKINPISREHLSRLPRRYWWVVIVAGVFTMARFSEAFLVLKAREGGLAVAWTPLVLIAMNVVYALAAYPFGKLADRMSHVRLLALGLCALLLADLVLAFGASLPSIAVGVALWGLHMGMTQGLLAAIVAEAAPADLRGTAFGLFNLVSGIAMLIASVVAGALWVDLSPAATFLVGAALCVLALAGILLVPARFRN